MSESTYIAGLYSVKIKAGNPNFKIKEET